MFNQISRNPKLAIGHPAVQLRPLQTTRRISFQSHSGYLADPNDSQVVCRSAYSFSEAYTGKTNCWLIQLGSEHAPKWFSKLMTSSGVVSRTGAYSPTSSIAKHPVGSSHKVHLTQTFIVLVRNKYPKLLTFSEASLTNRYQ